MPLRKGRPAGRKGTERSRDAPPRAPRRAAGAVPASGESLELALATARARGDRRAAAAALRGLYGRHLNHALRLGGLR